MKKFKYKIITGLVFINMLFGINMAYADKYKMAHVYEISHPVHIAAKKAVAKIKSETNGRVDIIIYPYSSLGKEKALWITELRIGFW